MDKQAPLVSRALAEFIGTAFLLATIVGSGIMATRLTDDEGLQLLQNALATGAILTALIIAFGPISGAHFNPAVTAADAALGGVSFRDGGIYIAAQITGGAVGVVTANLMFDLDVISVSETSRSGSHLWFAEVIATFGLVLIISVGVRTGRSAHVAYAVGTYIAAAYYFISSTGFANPAVTITRTLTNTFAGIEPASVSAFVIAELIGAALAVAATRALLRPG